MTRFFLISALIICVAKGGQPQAHQILTSAVTIEAFTPTGDRIDKIYVIARPLAGSTEYKAEGRDALLSLPAGNYTLTVQAPGFRTTQRLLGCYGSPVLITIALPVAPLHGQRSPVLSGRIMGWRGNPMALRILLVPILGTELEQMHPDNHGSFSFRSDPGPYMVITVIDSTSGPRIADTREIIVTEAQEITIDLSKVPDRAPVASPAP